MNRLEIPERAVDAALAENTAGLKSGEAELVRLEAAGPIIVVNRLRQLAVTTPITMVVVWFIAAALYVERR